VPGFIGNRLQAAILREAFHIVASEIATHEEVDTAVKQGFGRHLAETGIFGCADFNDYEGIFRELSSHLCNDTNIPKVLQQKVDAEKLGVKKGEGIYHWPAEKLAAKSEEREKVLFGHLVNDANQKQAKDHLAEIFHPHLLSDKKLHLVNNRLRIALLREGLYIVEMGVANPADIDLVVKYSFGRRLSVTGPFESADMGGLDTFRTILSYTVPVLCSDSGIFDQLDVRLSKAPLRQRKPRADHHGL
jgi:3-hydroxyacyl-CoA dehydrogenase